MGAGRQGGLGVAHMAGGRAEHALGGNSRKMAGTRRGLWAVGGKMHPLFLDGMGNPAGIPQPKLRCKVDVSCDNGLGGRLHMME